jgi:hypothetical protein
VENKRKQKGVIVVKSKERGARTKVTACNYSPDGNLIGGGALLRFFNYHSMNKGFNSVSGRGPTHVADSFKFRETQYDD